MSANSKGLMPSIFSSVRDTFEMIALSFDWIIIVLNLLSNHCIGYITM